MIKDLRVTISSSLSWDTHLILSSSRPTSSLDLWSEPALSQRTSMWGGRSTCFWWSPRWGTWLKCGPQTNTRSSVYKGEPHEMSKCRKDKLGCSKFSTKQKHYSDLGDTSSVLNFWVCSLDVSCRTGRGNSCGVGKCRLFYFSGYQFWDLLRSEPNPLCVSKKINAILTVNPSL